MSKGKMKNINGDQKNFVIEGTISKLTLIDKKRKFKICGAEEYSLIKKNKKETLKLNVLFPCEEIAGNEYVENIKETSNALIIPESYEFFISKDFAPLCSSALASGKKLRFVFEETTGSDSDDISVVLDKKIKAVSVSLLSN